MHLDLVPVTAQNWRQVADVEPQEDQRDFVAPVTRYLCLGLFDGVWTSLAVSLDEAVVGHVMWAFDEDEGAHWIGGVLVDADHQGRGVGRAAVEALIEYLAQTEGATRFALSYQPANVIAAGLYGSMGFEETGEVVEDEVVARRNR